MLAGKILVAERNGAFVIKLVGDVRLTFCTALDDFLEHMFEAPDFASVVIDLTETDNLDSTTLGQLAKLALAAQRRHHLTPALVSTNPNVTRVIDSMGFSRVFDIHHEALRTTAQLGELPQVPGTEQSVREKVIEAHRVLMGMNDNNRAQFQELVCALEASR